MGRTRMGRTDGRTDGLTDGRTDGQGGDYMLPRNFSGSIKRCCEKCVHKRFRLDTFQWEEGVQISDICPGHVHLQHSFTM